MTEHQNSSPLPPRWRRLLNHVFVIGLGFVLVGFLVWSFIMGTPFLTTSPKDEVAPPAQTQPGKTPVAAPPVASPVPPDSTEILKSQLTQVLNGVKAANQKKDLSQLLSYYSPNFPQLTQRAQSISKAWKIYDYPKMDFEIKRVRLLSDHAAVASVTWEIEAQNISTLKNQNISKTYLIKFARESGQWRIAALDKAE
jgi:hypothetical protein